MSSISSLYSLPYALSSSLSTSAGNMGRYLVEKLTPSKLLKTALVVAPAFAALQMMSSLPGADAGIICWTICMSACTGGSAGGFFPLCLASCTGLCATNPV